MATLGCTHSTNRFALDLQSQHNRSCKHRARLLRVWTAIDLVCRQSIRIFSHGSTAATAKSSAAAAALGTPAKQVVERDRVEQSRKRKGNCKREGNVHDSVQRHFDHLCHEDYLCGVRFAKVAQAAAWSWGRDIQSKAESLASMNDKRQRMNE